jgi:hypothetical protein
MLSPAIDGLNRRPHRGDDPLPDRRVSGARAHIAARRVILLHTKEIVAKQGAQFPMRPEFILRFLTALDGNAPPVEVGPFKRMPQPNIFLLKQSCRPCCEPGRLTVDESPTRSRPRQFNL